ncbi:MAG: 16S rRNA (adenine(1518)-N(6)/adenine(1519)-N(6))-dimethyltransferase RsmA [Fidelibacterota bacterium]
MRHHPRKRWGQNFLKDINLVNKLVGIISPEQNDEFLEIGPGEGILTEKLANKVTRLTAIEIDKRLYQKLSSRNNMVNCTFINADFLKTDWNDFGFIRDKVRVAGNIPYNITSPIIFRLLEYRSYWSDAHLMVQKEVADRLTAKPGGKDYGRLTVMTQSQVDIVKLITIPPDVFVPKPKVHSCLIRMLPHYRWEMSKERYQRFDAVVRTAFGQRRKMLHNSLADFDLTEVTLIDLARRPETLSTEDFITLAGEVTPM